MKDNLTDVEFQNLYEKCQQMDKLYAFQEKTIDNLMLGGGVAAFAYPPLAPGMVAFEAILGTSKLALWAQYSLIDRPKVCGALDKKNSVPSPAPSATPANPACVTPTPPPSNPSKAKIKKDKPSRAPDSDKPVCIEKDFNFSPDTRKKLDDYLASQHSTCDDLNNKINEMIDLQKQANSKLDDLKDRDDLQKDLQGLLTFSGFLVDLAQTVGSKELKVFATIAQAGIQITSAIVAFMGPMTVMAAFGPIGMIGSAVLAIVCLFMKPGPDPTEIVLKQIGRLSEQLSGLADQIQDNAIRNDKMQWEILQTCVSGMRTLQQQIDRRFNQLDIKIGIALEDIKNRLDFLIKVSEENAIENTTEELTTTCRQAEQLIEGAFSDAVLPEAEKHIRVYADWASGKSSHRILTGRTVFEANPQNNLLKEKFTSIDDYEKIHGFLGFFAEYVKSNYHVKFDDSFSIDKIANPDIWLKSVFGFVALNSAFMLEDKDPRNVIINQMIAIADNGKALTENLKKDKNLWSQLFKAYDDCLKTIQTHANNYAKDYGRTELDTLNKAQKPSIKQPTDITELDFIKPPEDFIRQFDVRFIDHLNGEIKPREDFKEATQHERDKFPSKFIYAESNRVSKEVKAAEFLQLLSLSAEQNTLLESHSVNMSADKWTMSFKLKVQMNGEPMSHDLAIMTHQGNYTNFDLKNDHKAHVEFVRDYLVRPLPHQRLIFKSYEQTTDLEKIKEPVNQYFIYQRKKIVSALVSSDIAGHQDIKKFQTALNDLDILVALIRVLAYLSDKNPDDALFKNLITSGAIKNDLIAFSNDEKLSSGWLSLLNIKPLQADAFIALLDVPHHSHTYRLWEQGKSRLELFKQWKVLSKRQFPVLSSYINPEIYNNQCIQVRHELFQQRVFDQAIVNTKGKFEEAKDMLNRVKHLAIAPDTSNSFYLTHSESLYTWAYRYARTPIFTEYTQKLPLTDLDNVPIGQFSQMYMQPYGWTSNIRTLMQYAAKFGECEFRGLTKNQQGFIEFYDDMVKDIQFSNPANMAMYLEGCQAYIQFVLNYAAIDEMASNANDNPQKRLKHINELEDIGIQLKSILIEMASSKKLFETLFTRYTEIINEPKKFIEKIEANDKEAEKLLATDRHAGGFQLLSNQLCAYGIWIQQYLVMSFGFETKMIDKNNLEFMGETYVLYTDTKDCSTCLTSGELKKYSEQIGKLAQAIQNRIAQADDLNKFYHYMLQCLKTPSASLVIDETVSPLPMNAEKIHLLTLLLRENAIKINKIAFHSVSINTNACLLLMIVLSHFKEIQSITLSKAELTPGCYEALSAYLPRFKQLRSLDISGNLIDHRHVNHVCQMVRNTPQLTALSLQECKIQRLELYLILSTLQQSKYLKTLDVSDNEYEDDHGLVTALALLVDQCQTINTVGIAHLALDVQSQQTLQQTTSLSNKLVSDAPLPQFTRATVILSGYDKRTALNQKLGQPALDQMLQELALNKVKLLS